MRTSQTGITIVKRMGVESDFQSMDQHLSKALSRLPVRLAKILSFRYGLEDAKQHDHDETAKKLNITVEQAVELESKAIRKLRHPRFSKPLVQTFDHLNDKIWMDISEKINDFNSVVLRKRYSTETARKLSGKILLTMQCIYGGIESWLSSHACETDVAWFRSDHSNDFIIKIFSKMQRIDREPFFPIPVGFFLDQFQLDFNVLGLLIILDQNQLDFYRGHIARRPLSSLDMRAIRIHLLLLYQHPGTMVDFDKIIHAYNDLYLDDELTLSVFRSTVETKINLFRLTGDGRCCATGSVDDIEQYDQMNENSGSEEKKRPYIFMRPWSETKAEILVKEILEAKGICRRKDIFLSFQEKTGHRYTAYEYNVPVVTAVLRSAPDIVELAPSIYGLRSKLRKQAPEESDLLLSSRDCKKYVTRRYAGEPMNTFPLWTAAMEFKWCVWLERKMLGMKNNGSRRYYHQHRSYQKLLESLLCVSDPDQWPVVENEKTIWRFRKQAWEIYHYRIPIPDDIWGNTPSLQNFFTVGNLAKQLGYMNYFRTNEALATIQISSPMAVKILSVLIMLEMLSPAENWQKMHHIGDRMDERLLSMVREIRKKGFLHWDDYIGRSLREDIQKMEGTKNTGWVDEKMIQCISRELSGKPMFCHNMDKKSENEEKIENNKQFVIKSQLRKKIPEQLELAF